MNSAPPAKKSKRGLTPSLFFLPVGFVLLLGYCLRVPLPTPEKPLVLYSNQTRSDLKLLTAHLIKRAQSSIHLASFHLTDPEMVRLLSHTSADLHIYVDKKNRKLKNLLPNAHIHRIACPGLMHEKALIIDEEITLIGSANMTHESLTMHQNLCAAIHSRALSSLLIDHLNALPEKPPPEALSIPLRERQIELWFLPQPKSLALNRLIHLIDSAKKEVFVSMFTFTHKSLADALIRAHERGVKTSVALDFYTASGSSKLVKEKLESAKVPVYLSRGLSLFHYKCALIDNETLIMGSANWTASAFKRNRDLFAIISPLTPKERRFCRRLQKTIYLDSCLDP